VIAYTEHRSGRKTIVAVGSAAKAKIGRTPANLFASHPIKDGVIADLDITESMLKHFMEIVQRTHRFMKPRVVISLPYGVSDIEKKAVQQAGLAAGAREVMLIDEPMAAAIGTGLPVHEPKGNMVIDIGGGTTESAVISLYGIVHCEAVRVGGHSFDQAIVSFIRRRYNLIVGDQSAEKLKLEIGSALKGGPETAVIRGIDFVTGLPRSISISAGEIHEAIGDLLSLIFEAARRTLEKTPPDLLGDIIRDGIVVTGGGALLSGLAERLELELDVPVRIASEPLLSIARGGEVAIRSSAILDRILIN
jgi:rod shape-determining protein MreB